MPGSSLRVKFRVGCRHCLAAAIPALALLAQPHAQTTPRLWVLHPPDAIIAYDTATFEPRQTVKLPPTAIPRAGDLRVSFTGRIVLLPPAGPPVTEEARSAAGRIWLWDGSGSAQLLVGDQRGGDGPANGSSVTDVVRTVFLSASEDALVWLENRFEKTVESGVERSVRASARIWQTDLRGQRSRVVATLPASAACACDTGFCSETCPEWTLWVPDGLVGSFFLLTRVVPGQLETTTVETRLFRRDGPTWVSTTLAQPIEEPLAASRTASILIAAVPDGGCCGWENEGDDQLLLWRNGRSTTIYDERRRYDNPDYDVSFYPSDARLSPGLGMLAYTIASTARPGAEVRLADDGKANVAELARVRDAIGQSPCVEVVALRGTPAKAATIPHASLVGWVNDRELLVAQDGRLIVYATNGTRIRDTAIRVRSAADAFLR